MRHTSFCSRFLLLRALDSIAFSFVLIWGDYERTVLSSLLARAHTIDLGPSAKECFFEDLHNEDKVCPYPHTLGSYSDGY